MKNHLKRNPYLYLSLLIFVFFMITTIFYPYLSTADYFDHSSAVKELSIHLSSPKDPQLNIDHMESPRYTPYTLLLGIFSRITGLDVFIVMKLAGLLNIVLFLFFFYLLMNKLFNDKKLPIYSLVMLLFFWGFGWNISSGYNLKLLVFVLPYPSFLSFSLSFLGIYLVIRYLREEKAFFYLTFLIIGFFIFLIHFPSFTFFMLSSLLITFLERYKNIKKKILSFVPLTRNFKKENFLVLILPVIVFVLSFLWPYYSFYKLVFLVKGNMLLSLPLTLSKLFIITGPLLFVGIPIWLSYYKNKKIRFLWWAFLTTFIIFIFYFFLPVPYSERYLFYMAFYLQIVIAVKYKELNIFSFRQWIADIKYFMKKGLSFYLNKKSGKQNIIKLLLAAVLLLAIAFQLVLVGSFYTQYYTGKNIDRVEVNEYKALGQQIGTYDVFIADKKTSHVLPTFSGRAVGHYDAHLNEFVLDHSERTKALEVFFDKSTSDEVRNRILNKYEVSYIVVNFKYEDHEFYEIMADYGEIAYKTDDFALIQLKQGG